MSTLQLALLAGRIFHNIEIFVMIDNVGISLIMIDKLGIEYLKTFL